MEGTIGPAGESNEPYQAPSSFQKIEVTDRLVPEGTDFTTPGKLKLGEVTVRDDQLLVEWFFFLEVDPGPGSEHLLMYAAPTDNPGSLALSDRLGTPQGADVAWWARGAGPDHVAPMHFATTTTLGVYLDPFADSDAGLTYTPITIIRAIASFLII